MGTLSFYKKVFDFFLKRFQTTKGRQPMNPAEYYGIEREAVDWVNKTKGQRLPGTPEPTKPLFQGWTPKVIEGGKGKEGIGTLLKDSPEAIAKIKADNKAAAERLRKKKLDEEPDDLASGGIARVGYLKGKIVKGILSLGKKKKPKINRKLTKDELDDLYEEFDEAVPYPMKTVGDKEKFLKAVKDEEAYMFQQYKKGNLDPKPGEPNRKRFLEKKLEEMELSGDKRLMTRDEIEELSSFDLGTEMDEAIKKSKTLTPEEELRREFPGIDDRLIKNILADTNPQRIAEVKQTMREALKMQEKGMSPDEIIKLFKDTTRTKQASGGIAGELHLNQSGRVSFTKGGKVSRGLAHVLGA